MDQTRAPDQFLVRDVRDRRLPAIILIQDPLFQPSHIKTIPDSEFQQLVDKGKVTDLVVGPDQITWAYKAPKGKANTPRGEATTRQEQPKHFVTQRVPEDQTEILAKKGLPTSPVNRDPGVLSCCAGWSLLSASLIWIGIRMALGRGSAARCRSARAGLVSIEKDIKTTFADVAASMNELKEVVSFLEDPQSYGRLEPASPTAWCWPAPLGPARRCWNVRLRARQAWRSSRSRAQNSSRCSSVSGQPECATSSSRRADDRLSTNGTLSAAPAAAFGRAVADTTRQSRP